jgi:hypothetical protein
MPTFSRITEQEAYDAVVEANRRFRSGNLPDAAYEFFHKHGVVVETWVLAMFGLNDEGPCHAGNLVTADASVFFFQVDLSDSQNCLWERLDTLPTDTRHPVRMALVLLDELSERPLSRLRPSPK